MTALERLKGLHAELADSIKRAEQDQASIRQMSKTDIAARKRLLKKLEADIRRLEQG